MSPGVGSGALRTPDSVPDEVDLLGVDPPVAIGAALPGGGELALRVAWLRDGEALERTPATPTPPAPARWDEFECGMPEGVDCAAGRLEAERAGAGASPLVEVVAPDVGIALAILADVGTTAGGAAPPVAGGAQGGALAKLPDRGAAAGAALAKRPDKGTAAGATLAVLGPVVAVAGAGGTALDEPLEIGKGGGAAPVNELGIGAGAGTALTLLGAGATLLGTTEGAPAGGPLMELPDMGPGAAEGVAGVVTRVGTDTADATEAVARRPVGGGRTSDGSAGA